MKFMATFMQCFSATHMCSTASLAFLVTLLSISSAVGCSHAHSVPIFGVEVVNEFPHDINAFTEGLLYAGNDTLFESTGLYGNSSVRRVALTTGKVEILQNMDESSFGEGMTLFSDRLLQVTYKSSTGFIYNQDNLNKIKAFTNPMTDGWGLATDGKVLFGSDGTPTLYKIDPQTFKVLEYHNVTYKHYQVLRLNELEYVNGEVWANVGLTDCIVRLSCKDGAVLGWIYAPNLREGMVTGGDELNDVLNGIA